MLAAIQGLNAQEMPRCKERGFCCGAGGARMWMEEKIGKQINVERTDEALGLDPDIISTACPFCMVMLSDAVTAKQQAGSARDDVQVLDVSQILARSLVAPAKEPAMAGASALRDASVEAPKPVAATAAQTATADAPQLAQTGGSASETTAEGHGPAATDPGSPIASSSAGDAPGGATEGQGPGSPSAPEPKPE